MKEKLSARKIPIFLLLTLCVIAINTSAQQLPSLKIKISVSPMVWMGDMDALYSNVATRFLQAFLDKTENPKSDATLLFSPMEGHTQEWSDKAVLTLIGERVARMNMP